MKTIHFCIESFDPREGGMEESALRLLQCLVSDPDLIVITYVLSKPIREELTGTGDVSVDIASRVSQLLAPLPAHDGTNAALRKRETTRLQVMFLRDALRLSIGRRPADRHILLSYYISTAGFVAQHVASELNIPHIACSRGSDLGRDLFTKDGVAGIEFVVKRATHVVTTNLEHRLFVENICGRQGSVQVIYNSIPSRIKPVWSRRDDGQVRLVSLGGYSLKKGTHLLLDSICQLLDEGLPLHFSLVGSTGPGNWTQLCEPIRARFAGRVSMKGLIERDDVEQFLMAGDVFCSASLSEGCSNAANLALGLGMPIVSTATGMLVDTCREIDHVCLTRPGDREDLTHALRRTVKSILEDRLTIDTIRLEKIIDALSPEREREQWLALINMVAQIGQY